ncbi:acyl-CoA dehydratase activase [Nocardia jiangxiensis]|uniref:Acyl-CoA dehydratase activase n=1 Tax=Nocardia jiangxiensis TaxID=282685 RepID=A0ABW6S8P4_9NOCA|nr:acyl-CoA dehydratase activase [Nocardia jiangxiensis]
MNADNWFVLGVDLGSTTAKAAVVDRDGELRGADVVQMGAVSPAAVARAIDGALRAAAVSRDEIRWTVSTGYGRKLVPGADRSYTEITCHARGAAALRPGVRLVIDIGGQDSKAIIVDDEGLVDRFAMNDRCASGTGRFFDVLARALEAEIEEVGELALAGSDTLEVSSMCATFAETEVISLLAQGRSKADVAASVHRAVAARTLGLVAQVGRVFPAVMTGGVAKNPAALHYVSQALRHPVELLEQPQIAGAYGAGLLARDEYLGTAAARSERDAAAGEQVAATAAAVTPHCLDCDGVLAQPADAGPVPIELRRSAP